MCVLCVYLCASEAGERKSKSRRMCHGRPSLLYASVNFILTISGVYIFSHQPQSLSDKFADKLFSCSSVSVLF